MAFNSIRRAWGLKQDRRHDMGAAESALPLRTEVSSQAEDVTSAYGKSCLQRRERQQPGKEEAFVDVMMGLENLQEQKIR